LNKNLIAGLIIGLIVGLIIGIAVGPKPVDVSEYEQQINSLQSQISSLQSQINDLQDQLSEKENEISQLQDYIKQLEMMIPPLSKSEWNKIIEFKGGNFDMTTELFNIPSDTWRIKWNYTGDDQAAFFVWICEKGKEFFVDDFIVKGPSQSGIYYLYFGPGTYYLKIGPVSISEWTIVIEVYVPP